MQAIIAVGTTCMQQREYNNRMKCISMLYVSILIIDKHSNSATTHVMHANYRSLYAEICYLKLIINTCGVVVSDSAEHHVFIQIQNDFTG